MGCIFVRPVADDLHDPGSFTARTRHFYSSKKQMPSSKKPSAVFRNAKVPAPQQPKITSNTIAIVEPKIISHTKAAVENVLEESVATQKKGESKGSATHAARPARKLKRSSSEGVVKKDKYMLEAHTNPRLSNLPKHLEGEQVAAGWPPWLSTIAGEALIGWIPRRADSFEKLSKVGQGTYSNVYKARDLESLKIVALKKVKFDNLEPESVRFMLREIKILRRLDHPNIMKLEGLVTSRMSCSLYLVFEYMDHDLAGLISHPEVSFTEAQIKCYFQQLLLGLDHCHKCQVMHRDIKGSNLLLDGKGNLKIADFGLASFFKVDQTHAMTSRVVTLWYRPPELLLGATIYGVEIDIWSAGCILAELFAGRPIMPGRTEVEQLHKIFKLCGSPTEDYWKKSNLPHANMFKSQQPYKRCLSQTYKDLPPTALDLLERFLAIDPAQRGTAADALQSEFFKTKPLACDPSSLPKYPPSKEYDARQRLEEARRQAEIQAKSGKKSSLGDSKWEFSKRSDADKPPQPKRSSKKHSKSKSSSSAPADDPVSIDMKPTLQKSKSGRAERLRFGSSPPLRMKIAEERVPKSGPLPINDTAQLMAIWKHKHIEQQQEDSVCMAPPQSLTKDLQSVSINYLRGSQSSKGR